MFSRFRLLLVAISVTVLCGLTSTAAYAQRPALTRSADEPGRAPYHQYINGSCVTGTCRFAFKAVPAGFRLVITHVSVITVGTNSFLGYLSDEPGFTGAAASDGSTNAIVLAEAPRVAGGTLSVSSSLVTFYVDGGKSPNIVITGSGTPNASINGYLVALD